MSNIVDQSPRKIQGDVNDIRRNIGRLPHHVMLGKLEGQREGKMR